MTTQDGLTLAAVVVALFVPLFQQRARDNRERDARILSAKWVAVEALGLLADIRLRLPDQQWPPANPPGSEFAWSGPGFSLAALEGTVIIPERLRACMDRLPVMTDGAGRRMLELLSAMEQHNQTAGYISEGVRSRAPIAGDFDGLGKGIASIRRLVDRCEIEMKAMGGGI